MFSECKSSEVAWLLAAAVWLTAAPVAAETFPHPAGQTGEAPYGGVVTNQTVTVAGQDFFQHFVAAWRERDLSERFSLSIHERPSARWGSQIWIEFAQRRIFQAALPSGRGAARSLADRAIEVAYQTIGDAEVERLLFRDADIGPDEM